YSLPTTDPMARDGAGNFLLDPTGSTFALKSTDTSSIDTGVKTDVHCAQPNISDPGILVPPYTRCRSWTGQAPDLGAFEDDILSSPPPSDPKAPSAPTGVTATPTSSVRISLSWTASTDNVGVAGYNVYRSPTGAANSFTQVGTPKSTAYADSALSPSTTYYYQIKARDAAGNLSAASATVSATTQAPPVPDGAICGPLPLDLRIGQLGMELSCDFYLTNNPALASAAMLTLTAFDIDAANEATVWVNPTADPLANVVPLPPSIL